MVGFGNASARRFWSEFASSRSALSLLNFRQRNKTTRLIRAKGAKSYTPAEIRDSNPGETASRITTVGNYDIRYHPTNITKAHYEYATINSPPQDYNYNKLNRPLTLYRYIIYYEHPNYFRKNFPHIYDETYSTPKVYNNFQCSSLIAPRVQL